MTTYEIHISCKQTKTFRELVDIIKRTGGCFDPDSRSWTITADGDPLDELATYAGRLAGWLRRDGHQYLTITAA